MLQFDVAVLYTATADMLSQTTILDVAQQFAHRTFCSCTSCDVSCCTVIKAPMVSVTVADVLLQYWNLYILICITDGQLAASRYVPAISYKLALWVRLDL